MTKQQTAGLYVGMPGLSLHDHQNGIGTPYSAGLPGFSQEKLISRRWRLGFEYRLPQTYPSTACADMFFPPRHVPERSSPQRPAPRSLIHSPHSWLAPGPPLSSSETSVMLLSFPPSLINAVHSSSFQFACARSCHSICCDTLTQQEGPAMFGSPEQAVCQYARLTSSSTEPGIFLGRYSTRDTHHGTTRHDNLLMLLAASDASDAAAVTHPIFWWHRSPTKLSVCPGRILVAADMILG